MPEVLYPFNQWGNRCPKCGHIGSLIAKYHRLVISNQEWLEISCMRCDAVLGKTVTADFQRAAS